MATKRDPPLTSASRRIWISSIFGSFPPHTPIGWTNNGFHLEVQDEQGQNVADRFFYACNGEIRTSVPIMPGMLTLNSRIIRQDCLCYLMERYPLAG